MDDVMGEGEVEREGGGGDVRKECSFWVLAAA